MYTLSKTEPIAIYGGGQIGKSLATKLQSDGYSVVGIIDRNPDGVSKSPVKVYSVNDYYKLYGDTFIWVSLGRGLEHPFTAKVLNDVGFSRILFLPLHLRSKLAKQMITAYNSFFIGEYNIQIPSYEELFRTMPTDYIISMLGDFVTAVVPIEHLWSADPKITLGNHSNPYNITFAYNKQYDEYSKELNKPISSFSFDKEVEGQVSCDKYYELYDNAMSDFDFWIYGAIAVTLAKKNHFNIIDGGHRALYLASRGINGIPCRILQSEWETYFCELHSQNLMNYCKNLEALPQKIIHPAFMFFPVSECNDNKFNLLLEGLYRE